MGKAVGEGLKAYYKAKIEELEILARDKHHNLQRLQAQRNELNTKGIAPCQLPGNFEVSRSRPNLVVQRVHLEPSENLWLAKMYADRHK
jgi:hypothetical protein